MTTRVFSLLAVALVAVAAHAAPAPSTTAIAGDGSDLDSARAGLARILADAPNASIEPYAPLGPCPLVDRATVNGELADAGIDAPLGDWTRLAYPDGPHTDVLLACEGTYIGVDEDPSFPELRFDVVAIDLGDAATAAGVLHDELEATGEPLRITDLEGGTIGECGDEDLAIRCAEWWQHDGFVVGVEIVDRVFVDRPTASTVLGGLVPAIVSTLGLAASDIADPLQTISAADAGRALDALEALVDANPEAVSSEHERIDCPLLDSESLRPALDDAGIDWPLGGWAASISPVTFPRGLDPVPQRVLVHQPIGIGDRRRDRLRRRRTGGRLRGVGRRRRGRIGGRPCSRRPHGRAAARARAAPSTATSGGAATASCSA